MKVSVVMPVYNGEKYLNEAIDSVLNQTFSDFEFIIINDCSTDNTENIIKSYNDDRIIYIKNDVNMGVAYSLNKGINISKGDYIIRMDSDDISLPERFRIQVEYMDNNPDVAVCGCKVSNLINGKIVDTYTVFGHEDMKISMLFSSSLCHPAVIMRKSVLAENDYAYDNKYDKLEDYELWTRIFVRYKIDNISDNLFLYRIHPNQVTRHYTDEHKNMLFEIKKKMFERLSIYCTDDEFSAYFSFCVSEFNSQISFLDLISLFENIYLTNKKTKQFCERKLKAYLSNILINIYSNQNLFKYKDIKDNIFINKIDIYKYKILKVFSKFI